MIKSKKRHLTLLEVLIALLLVMVTLPILISSFVFTTVEQQKMIAGMSINRVANHAFAVIFEDLAVHRITYNVLESDREFPLEEKHLGDTSGRWSGTYRFKKLKPDKPKQKNYYVELWEVLFDFSQANSKEKKHFAYHFIVIRDLTHLGAQEEEKEKTDEKK